MITEAVKNMPIVMLRYISERLIAPAPSNPMAERIAIIALTLFALGLVVWEFWM